MPRGEEPIIYRDEDYRWIVTSKIRIIWKDFPIEDRKQSAVARITDFHISTRFCPIGMIPKSQRHGQFLENNLNTNWYCVNGDGGAANSDSCGDGFDTDQNGVCTDINECEATSEPIPKDGMCTVSESCTAPGFGSGVPAARAYCQSHGGDLWAPRSQADFDYVQSLSGQIYLGLYYDLDSSAWRYYDTDELYPTEWWEGSVPHPDAKSTCLKREKT